MKNSEERIEHIIQRMLNDRSVDAPVDAIKYAKNLYRSRMTESQPSLVKRVLAVLKADLAPDQAAFGERSAWSSHARQMFFESGENAVDLRIKSVQNGFEITGQVLGEGFENGAMDIANTDASVQAIIGENSTFKVTGLSAGKYQVAIRGAQTEIFIEELDIR
jgi:hypothetical protein